MSITLSPPLGIFSAFWAGSIGGLSPCVTVSCYMSCLVLFLEDLIPEGIVDPGKMGSGEELRGAEGGKNNNKKNQIQC